MKTASFFTVAFRTHFRNLLIAQLLSQVALNMLTFVLGIMVYEKTKSNASVSLILLSFGIPAVIFGIIAGNVVDFYDKRIILIAANFIRMVILIGFFLFHRNIYAIYVLTVAMAIVTQFFIPAEAPAIPRLVDPSQLLTANSIFTLTYYFSTLSGFILAGPMLRLWGGSGIFLFMAAGLFLATVSVIGLPAVPCVENKKSKDGSEDSLGRFFNSLKEGIEFIVSHPRIRQAIVLLTFSQVMLATLSVLAPGFADRILTIDLTDASYLVLGPAAVGLGLGALWVGKNGTKYRKGLLISAGLVLTGVMLIALGHLSIVVVDQGTRINGWYPLAIAGFLLVVLGFANSLISVAANTMLQAESHDHVRGRVYGFLTTMIGGVSFLPVILSGFLADWLGIGVTLGAIGLTIVISLAFYWVSKNRHSIH